MHLSPTIPGPGKATAAGQAVPSVKEPLVPGPPHRLDTAADMTTASYGYWAGAWLGDAKVWIGPVLCPLRCRSSPSLPNASYVVSAPMLAASVRSTGACHREPFP